MQTYKFPDVSRCHGTGFLITGHSLDMHLGHNLGKTFQAHRDAEYELDLLSKFDIGRDPLPDWMLWASRPQRQIVLVEATTLAFLASVILPVLRSTP